MRLWHLKLENFRNIGNYNGEFSLQFNLFTGNNGSGKTSLLEAIYVIGHAKSFRTHILNQTIQHHHDNFVLFAQAVEDNELVSIGIERHLPQTTRIKLNTQPCKSASELAQLFPMQVLNPDSYNVLDASPKYRRQFLDWGLFHVEHRFLSVWRRFQRALVQRNSALKSGLPALEINAWNDEIAHWAHHLDEFRQQYFGQLWEVLASLLAHHTILQRLTGEYDRGWPGNENYANLLAQNLPKDRHLGYTSIGPQRADIKFKFDEYPAHSILSRGQQKILVSFLGIAQGKLCRQLSNKTCIYLVDDLASELDQTHQEFLIQQLAELQSQVFITGIDHEELQALLKGYPYRMFHVEQGQINNCSIE